MCFEKVLEEQDVRLTSRFPGSVVSQIRFEEQQTKWTVDVEERLEKPSQGEVYPSMPFTLAKDRMETTKLWQIIKKMPKGALLHCHFEAMIDQDWLIREALETHGLHISSQGSLEGEPGRLTTQIAFRYKSGAEEAGASIYDTEYTPHRLVPLAVAAESFPDGGREGFVAWLKSRCSISRREAMSSHQGTACIWAKFLDCFATLKSLIFYEPLYRKCLAKMFQQLVEDGIQYVDLRAAFAFEYQQAGSDASMDTEDGYVEVIRVLGEEVGKFQATPIGKDFWGARMIWTTIRAFDNRAICESESRSTPRPRFRRLPNPLCTH